MPAQAVLILHENRAPMEHSAHLAPLSTTNVQAAEAQIRAEMGFPAALAEWESIIPVSPVAVAFNGKAFLSSESGASALDARSNPMIVGPQPVTAGFAELGCNLLAQTSRGHILTGSGAKMGWCLTKSGATSVESGLSRGCRRPSMSARRPSVRRLSVESVESMAMVDGYSTRTLGTTG